LFTDKADVGQGAILADVGLFTSAILGELEHTTGGFILRDAVLESLVDEVGFDALLGQRVFDDLPLRGRQQGHLGARELQRDFKPAAFTFQVDTVFPQARFHVEGLRKGGEGLCDEDGQQESGCFH
jgi:hypothetical protein